jgi:hypothetical protein
MAESIRKIDPDDLIVWADGTACHVHELHEFRHLSDDYEVVPYGTSRWVELDNRNKPWTR